MIEGINGENGKIYSPLHLEPIEGGYRHRTNEHEKSWVYDLLSGNQNGGEIKTILKMANLIEGYNRKTNDNLMRYFKNKNNEIYREDKLKIVFERDCCFSTENIFFSSKDAECPISFNFEFLELIEEGFKESKKKNRLTNNGGPTLDSPFGSSSNPRKPGEFIKYGQGHLFLKNNLAENFMKLLYKSMERK